MPEDSYEIVEKDFNNYLSDFASEQLQDTITPQMTIAEQQDTIGQLKSQITFLLSEVKRLTAEQSDRAEIADKEIESIIWEKFEMPLSLQDKADNSPNYKKYLIAVKWAKWMRDNLIRR